MSSAPIDVVLPRLKNPRRNARGWSAICPNHPDRSASLSVGVGRDDAVLLHCFAGCSAGAVAAALGLAQRDLFRSKDHLRHEYRQRDRLREEYRKTPRQSVEDFIVRGVEKHRELRLQRWPYDTPLVRSVDVNAARARANAVFGLRLEPIAAFDWEGFEPHDRDPAWPCLFERALEEEAHRYFHFLHLEAAAWETGELPKRLHPHVADVAARWLHRLALESESPGDTAA